MITLLATAHTWRGGDGSFTPAPILGLLLTLLLIRFALQLRIGPPAFAIAIVLGTVFATTGATFGYSVAAAIWVSSSLLVASVRTRAGTFHRNRSD